MTRTRTFTPEEIADIVTETVENSVKDLESVAEVIRLVAMVTQELKDLLFRDKQVVIDRISGARGGLTIEKSLAWKAAVMLKERA